MKAPLYVETLEQTLLPFIQEVFPDGHHCMQDYDPKHTSLHARKFLEDNNVKWWKTPPESPDANPIENLWQSPKKNALKDIYAK